MSGAAGGWGQETWRAAPGGAETTLTVAGESPAVFLERARAAGRDLAERGFEVVRCDMFGPADLEQPFRDALGEVAGAWVPSMWVVPRGPAGAMGTIVAVSGTKVTRSSVDGRAVLTRYELSGESWSTVSGLLPHDLSQSPQDQTRDVFTTLERALVQAGMGLGDVVRTWFFLDRIHSWYGQFNGVRTSLYRDRGLVGRLLPASTGVGAPNAAGAALTATAVAVRPATPAKAIVSDRQGPAFDYGSAFSRAVSVGQRLFVSGTASIAPDGSTAYPHDPVAQIPHTMDAVAALVAAAGGLGASVSRSLVYCADDRARAAFHAWRDRHVARAPVALVLEADICRPDLLFEIEQDLVLRKECP